MKKISRVLFATALAFAFQVRGGDAPAAAAEPKFYSNALYRADFHCSPSTRDRSVDLNILGKKFHTGYRVETRGVEKVSAIDKGTLAHAFEKLPDGLKYTFDKEFGLRNTNTVVGTVRFAYTFRPNQIVYEVTIAPKGSWDFGHCGDLFFALVWPLNPTAFQGMSIKKTFADGTSVMNTFDFNVKDFDGNWLPGNGRLSRVDLATADELITLTASESPAHFSFGRYGGANGGTLEIDLNYGKPAGTGWNFTFDKPATFSLTFDVKKWETK